VIRRTATLLLFVGLSFTVAAEDAQTDPYQGLFVSDLAVCEHAARTNLSDALFEFNATAIIPYEGLTATEFYCEFTGVEREPAANGFELFATASCNALDDSYEDLFWIVPADAAAVASGAAISVNSKHFDEALETTSFRPFYRCDNLDPETLER
jgi:hypothetical protein